LAAIYSLILTENRLPSKVHDKVAEFVIKQGISVENIMKSHKNFQENNLLILAKYSFEDLESTGPETYLYKYNLRKTK
jgi:hypothetical protein